MLFRLVINDDILNDNDINNTTNNNFFEFEAFLQIPIHLQIKKVEEKKRIQIYNFKICDTKKITIKKLKKTKRSPFLCSLPTGTSNDQSILCYLTHGYR